MILNKIPMKTVFTALLLLVMLSASAQSKDCKLVAEKDEFNGTERFASKPVQVLNRVDVAGMFVKGKKPWQLSTHFRSEGSLLYLVVQRCWDSLERVRIEQELRSSDRRKDEFIATLAHELRNPLAPIRTGLTLMRRSADAGIRERTEAMMFFPSL